MLATAVVNTNRNVSTIQSKQFFIVTLDCTYSFSDVVTVARERGPTLTRALTFSDVCSYFNLHLHCMLGCCCGGGGAVALLMPT
jgi:hypothetical protein